MSNSIRPQTITEDSASGGKQILGSLAFDGEKEGKLQGSSITTAGNRKTSTCSFWIRRAEPSRGGNRLLFGYSSDSWIRFDDNDRFTWQDQSVVIMGNETRFEDINAWYHCHVQIDTTLAAQADRVKLHINGVRIDDNGGNTSYPAQDYEGKWLNSGESPFFVKVSGVEEFDGQISDFYLIDGEALDPTEFGYTDPLTNTWRPKKYTGNYNITSTDYDTTNATGGNTILNTNDAGTAVTSGNRTDSNSSYLKVAVPMNGSNNGTTFTDVVGGHTCTVTGDVHTDTAVSQFYGSSGQWDGTGDYITIADHSDWSLSGDFTIECWMRINTGQKGIMCCIGNFEDSTGFEFYAAGENDFRVFNGSGLSGYWFGYSGNPTAADNEWGHYALVRSSGVARAYVNGVDIGKTYSTNTTYSGDITIGGSKATSSYDYHDGYLQDFRLYNGVAKYTSDFVPPGRTVNTGVNSFHLPLDGSSPVGKDITSNGINFTACYVGGTTGLDKATGGLPILNTVSGGNVAVPGVRGQVGVGVTVYNDGGGNKYYLDGVKSTSGNVKFAPGQTVTFDTSDSTCSGHPLRLSANWDGSHTSYSSVDFDGVDGVLQYSNDAGFNFGTGAFTIEFWARVANVTQDHAAVISLYLFGGGPFIKLRTSNRWSLYFNKDGGGNDTHDIVGIGTYNEWHHLAWVREGTGTNEMKLYFDGTKVYEATYPTDIVGDNSAGHGLTIGKMQPSGGSTYFEGKLRDVRISKGVARYTSNFCPPNEPLTVDGNTSILVCNSSTTTAVSGNYTGVATAIGGVASGTSQNPFKEYVFGTTNSTVSEGTVGAATTITIPHNAPGELTYYCTAHTGMGGTVSIGATDVRIADPYAWKNVMALPLMGYDKTTEFSDKNDYSRYVNTTSLTKSVVQDRGAPNGSGNVSNFYGSSYRFDGSDDALEVRNLDGSASLDFGFDSSGTFTAEAWIYPTAMPGSSSGSFIWHFVDSDDVIGWNHDGTFNVQLGGSYNPTNLEPRIQTDRWQHYAVVSTFSETRGYLNGVLAFTDTGTRGNMGATNKVEIGNHASLGREVEGYLSDVKLYRGIEKYTENFIPASTIPTISIDSPSASSSGNALVQAKNGSVNFDGTDDFITMDDSADWEMGSDWTMECWLYCRSTNNGGGYQVFLAQRDSSSDWFWAVADDGNGTAGYKMGLEFYSSEGQLNSSDNPRIFKNRWHHVAISVSSNTGTFYIDGKSCGSGTVGTPASSGRLQIGSSGDEFNGFVSNVRIVKGTALYTRDFTPTKEPLTTTSQGAKASEVVFLGCQNPHSIYSLAKGPTATDNYAAGVYLKATTYADRGGSSCTVTNVGSVTSSSAGTNPFGITDAAAITGTQRVDIDMGNVSGTFFQSAWTLEMFFKTDDITEDNWFIGTSDQGASPNSGWSMDWQGNSGGTLLWNYSSGNPVDTGITASSNTWYFLRVQRTPGSGTYLHIELYDGPNSLVGSYTGTSTDGATQTMNVLKIGDANDNANNLDSNWMYSNVMLTAGRVGKQRVPTLSSSQRVDSATVSLDLRTGSGTPKRSSFNPFDDDVDIVRGQPGTYCSWDNRNTINYTDIDFTQGHLHIQTPGTTTSATAYGNTKGTVGVTTGKYYWEIDDYEEFGSPVSTGMFGVSNMDYLIQQYTGDQDSLAYRADNGTVAADAGSGATYGIAPSPGDKIGVALDMTHGAVYFSLNGQWQNGCDPESGSKKTGCIANCKWTPGQETRSTLTPAISDWNEGSGRYIKARLNCGQNPWNYPPPQGYVPLNVTRSDNRPVIVKSNNVVGVSTWSGIGASTQRIVTDSGFQPDLVWIKRRDSTSNMTFWDSVRGATKELQTDTAVSNPNESTNAQGLTSFNYDGFSLGNDSDVNDSSTSASYVAYTFKAGGNKGTWNVDGEDRGSSAAAGLTAGDTSVLNGCSINTKAGFGIIKWTQDSGGSTKSIAHGLTKAPNFVMMKHLNGGTTNWFCSHSGAYNYAKCWYMNRGEAIENSSDFNSVAPTSTVIATNTTGVDGREVGMWYWHDVPGLQKFGHFRGNAKDPNDTINNAHVYLGFKPALLILKKRDNYYSPFVWDQKRSHLTPPNNPRGTVMNPNDNGAEYYSSNYYVDFLADGFRVKSSHAACGADEVYLYMAWAQAPTINLFGAQTAGE